MWTLQIKRSHQQIYQLWIETISECPDKIQMFEILLLPKHLLWLPFNLKFENKKMIIIIILPDEKFSIFTEFSVRFTVTEIQVSPFFF